MSMREILGTLNDPSTKVGLEDAGVAVEEKEYSYFLELTPAQMQAVTEKYADCKKVAFLEAKLPFRLNDIKPRIREYYDPNTGDVANREYTVKKYDADGPAKTKLEENNDIGELGFIALLSTTKSFNSRVRYYIPIMDADGNVRRKKDGSDLCWELDIYNTANKVPSLWVKLEMEVDVVAVEDIKSIIPFEYNHIIDSDTEDNVERDLIQHFYDTEYNLYKPTSVAN